MCKFCVEKVLKIRGVEYPNNIRDNIACLVGEFQQALAAEALVGVLIGNRRASRGRELYACTLALSWILWLA